MMEKRVGRLLQPAVGAGDYEGVRSVRRPAIAHLTRIGTGIIQPDK